MLCLLLVLEMSHILWMPARAHLHHKLEPVPSSTVLGYLQPASHCGTLSAQVSSSLTVSKADSTGSDEETCHEIGRNSSGAYDRRFRQIPLRACGALLPSALGAAASMPSPQNATQASPNSK